MANLQQAGLGQKLLLFSSSEMRQAASAAGQMSQDTRGGCDSHQHGLCEDYPCSDLLPEWAAPHSWRLQAGSPVAAEAAEAAHPLQEGLPLHGREAGRHPGWRHRSCPGKQLRSDMQCTSATVGLRAVPVRLVSGVQTKILALLHRAGG